MIVTITRRACRWDGPKPVPEDFDGQLYAAELFTARFADYGLEALKRRVVSREPGAEFVLEWEGE